MFVLRRLLYFSSYAQCGILFSSVNVPKQVKVVAGLTNIEDKLGERHNVRLYIQHPLYEGAPIYRYDIGLIVLKDAFDFSTKVQPIKLLKRAVIPNQHVQVTGWGRVSVSLF